MTEMDEMKKLFEKLPWVREQFEIEREIIKHLVMAESEYLKALREIGWAEHLD